MNSFINNKDLIGYIDKASSERECVIIKSFQNCNYATKKLKRGIEIFFEDTAKKEIILRVLSGIIINKEYSLQLVVKKKKVILHYQPERTQKEITSIISSVVGNNTVFKIKRLRGDQNTPTDSPRKEKVVKGSL